MDFQRILAETFVASAAYYEEIGSTNDRARECASEELALPRLIVADRQTTGRGRGANRWWTGPGSLAMSLLLPPERVPNQAGQSALISLATAVAAIDAIHGMTETRRPGRAPAAIPRQITDLNLGLHWPNDIMLDGRKLGGILVEALPNRAHIIGLGINTNNTAADAPDELRDSLVTLRDVLGVSCDHIKLLVDFLQSLELGLRQLGAFPERIARRADEFCLQHGKKLSVQNGEQRISGLCQGIGLDGALLLETDDGVRAVYSGIVQE